MKILTSLMAVAGLLLLASAAQAGVITFDGSAGYTTFMNEYAAYRAFMGTPEDTITFDDIGASASPVGNYYTTSKGVTFSNELATVAVPSVPVGGSAVRLLAASGGAYGGWQQGAVAGYTSPATYDRVGGILYNKVTNADAANQLTITFAQPVQQVGSFVSNSEAGTVDPMSMTVTAYDSAGNVLTTVTAVTHPWGSWDNIEGFWGIKSDGRNIAKLTFLSPTPPPQYADVATLDNIEWVTPEPATMALVALGGAGMLLRRRRK